MPVERFYKLVVDNRCMFDEFISEMKKSGNQQKAVDKLQTIMSFVSQGQKVPTKQFQELKHRDKKDTYPDYELRAAQLRLYLFEDDSLGKIVVLGELKKEGKKTQRKSIEKMREIKLSYFASKTEEDE